MALIRDSKGRRDNETPSGYERLFGNRELGMLISKVQSAVISTGNELEKTLANKIKNTKGISIYNINKKDRIFKKAKGNHDINIDCVVNKEGNVYLIEIKDGDTFDTKKVAGELESLRLAKSFLMKKKISAKNILIKFCSFNATSHEQIERGAKGLLEEGMAMTGKELCALLDINFEQIVEERISQQKENLNYFFEELEKIS
ncbi:MAG TPA: hypothetical protein PKZ06_02510 [Candidatus Pacearchaeota archaeon]|nr:hypothetical protein [Candidatus Pacearchaeota archaeon]